MTGKQRLTFHPWYTDRLSLAPVPVLHQKDAKRILEVSNHGPLLTEDIKPEQVEYWPGVADAFLSPTQSDALQTNSVMQPEDFYELFGAADFYRLQARAFRTLDATFIYACSLIEEEVAQDDLERELYTYLLQQNYPPAAIHSLDVQMWNPDGLTRSIDENTSLGISLRLCFMGELLQLSRLFFIGQKDEENDLGISLEEKPTSLLRDRHGRERAVESIKTPGVYYTWLEVERQDMENWTLIQPWQFRRGQWQPVIKLSPRRLVF